MIVIDTCTINVSLVFALALASVVNYYRNDAPNCGVTYNCHYDDRNGFIIHATDHVKHFWRKFTNYFLKATSFNKALT
jgi:hypothetical protein